MKFELLQPIFYDYILFELIFFVLLENVKYYKNLLKYFIMINAYYYIKE